MPKIYRQIFREIYAIFAATLLILLTIIISFRLASLLNNVSRGEIAFTAIFHIISLQTLRFLLILAPISFILAAMMTLGRMHRDLEINALLASGISYYKQLQALLIAVLPLAISLFILQYFYLPEIYQRQEIIQKQARAEAASSLLNAQSFRQFNKGLVYAEARENGILKNFFLLQQDGEKRNLIYSGSASFTINNGVREFNLQQGQFLTWDENPHKQIDYNRFSNAKLQLPLSKIAQSDKLRNIPSAELNDSPAHRAEWQNRINPLISLLIFCGFLPLLARSPQRSGRYQKVLPAFLLFALYNNLLEALTSMIKKGKINIEFASFYLHIIILILLIFYWRSVRGPANA